MNEHTPAPCLSANEPDKRLIAAAPELLQTCEYVLNSLKTLNLDNGHMGACLENVIAKAKGEEL